MYAPTTASCSDKLISGSTFSFASAMQKNAMDDFPDSLFRAKDKTDKLANRPPPARAGVV